MDAEIPDGHKCHCQWQEFMPFPSKKSPTWTEGVNLDMEKKSFCWTRFERDNKTPMVFIVQDQMGPCGRISIESLSGSGWVYRESIEGPVAAGRPDITRAPVELSKEGAARQQGYAMCPPAPAD